MANILTDSTGEKLYLLSSLDKVMVVEVFGAGHGAAVQEGNFGERDIHLQRC